MVLVWPDTWQRVGITLLRSMASMLTGDYLMYEEYLRMRTPSYAYLTYDTSIPVNQPPLIVSNTLMKCRSIQLLPLPQVPGYCACFSRWIIAQRLRQGVFGGLYQPFQWVFPPPTTDRDWTAILVMFRCCVSPHWHVAPVAAAPLPRAGQKSQDPQRSRRNQLKAFSPHLSFASPPSV